MRAVAFCLTEDERVFYETFTGPDCLNRAHAFREASEDDFPGSMWAVTGDEEAANDRTERIMASLRSDSPPAEESSDDR